MSCFVLSSLVLAKLLLFSIAYVLFVTGALNERKEKETWILKSNW